MQGLLYKPPCVKGEKSPCVKGEKPPCVKKKGEKNTHHVFTDVVWVGMLKMPLIACSLHTHCLQCAGLLGAATVQLLLDLFKYKDPIARGLATAGMAPA